MKIKKEVEIPIIDKYDVVVAGGGLAGFGAACAAARSKKKTLLIERLEQLGGLGSSGGVGNFSYGDGFVKAQGRIFDEIISGLKSMKALGEENGYQQYSSSGGLFYNMTFDHNILPLVLNKIAEDSGVDLLFATEVVGVEKKEDRIKHVIIHNRSLLQAVSGKVFIDGTGEGILSRHAGAEILPVEDQEHPPLLWPSLMIFLHKAEDPQKQPLLGEKELDDESIDYSFWSEPDRMGLKLKNLFDETPDTGSAEEYSQATMKVRNRIPEYVRHFQENHDSEYVYDYAAPMFGLREGRRIKGDYILKVEDLKAGRTFEDSIAYGTSCLDTHFLADGKPQVPPYHIPYRSIIVENTDNLFTVGRCFSADRLSLSSARVMATCCLMGQAAGYGAAISVKENKAIRKVDTARIRARLLQDAQDEKIMEEKLCP